MITNEILITKYLEHTMLLALVDNRLEYLEVLDAESYVGRIFVGRVENIVSNINSAFVKFLDDQNGYLSLKDVVPECVLSRDFNENPKLRIGDLVLVQVSSDALKTKLPKLTCKLSLSGKFSALTMGEKGVGCSRKLPEDKRNQLINTIREEQKKRESIATFKYGTIIRTDAGENGVTAEDIIAEISLLEEQIKQMIEKAAYMSPYQEIQSATNKNRILEITKRFIHVVRCFNHDHIQINTDIEPIFNEVSSYKNELSADNEDHVSIKFFDPDLENARPLSVIYGLNSKLDECQKKKVWLKSGGYLVIEQTEALNVIDVNTGKSINGKKNIIEKLNIEAMEESMRQIRLRNLSGMILIDFINMKDKDENNHLIDNIKAMTKLDPININFIDITGLGIIELTRKKTGKSLIEVLTK